MKRFPAILPALSAEATSAAGSAAKKAGQYMNSMSFGAGIPTACEGGKN